MLELWSGPTPNGRKVSIFLEEAGLEWCWHYVDILDGDQFKPEFLALNPNNKFPVLRDPEGPDGEPITLWESGAILVYLAEKTGRFLPPTAAGRYTMLQWIMFQMAGVGPMFGQFAHFFYYAKDKIPYAIDRYRRETERLMRVMDQHLQARSYFVEETYTIADMCILPWVINRLDATPGQRPHLEAWAQRLRARPAVQRGLVAFDEKVRPEIIQGGLKGFSDEHRAVLFGAEQYRER
ncbi:MAG: glutathione S-transferase [Gammaproteobacteria bacterium]|nr:MAG: glutathione S-transferase [Gammaproteobacteria bacterium]